MEEFISHILVSFSKVKYSVSVASVGVQEETSVHSFTLWLVLLGCDG